MSEPNPGRIVISKTDLESASPRGPDQPAPSRGLGFGNIALLIIVAAVLAALISIAVRVARRERAAAAQISAPSGSGSAALSGPSDVCLVIDRSGSMNGRPLDDAKAAAREFVSGLKEGDGVAVIDFGTDIRVAAGLQKVGPPPSAGVEPVLRAIDSIRCDGTTALWDAGLKGVEILSSSGSGRNRVEILLTDGMNNASRHTLDDLITQAKASHVIIHTVALGVQIDRASLKRIADETGASFHQAQSSRQLHGIYQDLGQRLHK